MIVLKFGGTSVGDAAAIGRAAIITRDALPRGPVVVVSALAGVTSALLDAADQGAAGHRMSALQGVEALRERHLREACALLASDHERDETCSALGSLLNELAGLVDAMSVLGHQTPRSRDAVAALGERMSSLLVAAAFRAAGLPAVHVDSRSVVITTDHFTEAAPLPERIERESHRHILPLLRAGRMPVLGGFIGATAEGITTTLGRGGSDLSASLLGAALGAEEVEIWTDVDGILTADPRSVDGASPIAQIRFEEAAELSAFGARVLHPGTLAPAMSRGIPVVVRNSMRPEGAGTRISSGAPARVVSAIAGRPEITLVRVRWRRTEALQGWLERIGGVFARHHAPVTLLAASETSITAALDRGAALEDLFIELMTLGDVALERDRAVIAVVGFELAREPRTIGRALAALAGMPLHVVALGATGISLTVVVDAERLPHALRSLHGACFPQPVPA